ncbi:MAG: hypothetical protein WBO70_02055 [Erysipelotrichaceae bacterium]
MARISISNETLSFEEEDIYLTKTKSIKSYNEEVEVFYTNNDEKLTLLDFFTNQDKELTRKDLYKEYVEMFPKIIMNSSDAEKLFYFQTLSSNANCKITIDLNKVIKLYKIILNEYYLLIKDNKLIKYDRIFDYVYINSGINYEKY